MKLPIYTALILSFTSSMAFAGASGLYFSPEEISANRRNAVEISNKAVACLQGYWKEHSEFFAKNGYSKFYGNRNKRYATPEYRRFAIMKILYPNLVRDGDEGFMKEAKARMEGTKPEETYIGFNDFAKFSSNRDRGLAAQLTRIKPDLVKREKELKDISCVDLTRRCLGSAFDAVGMGETWRKIDSHVRSHGVSGVEMQKGLVDLGWESIYWNPDPSQNQAWDEEDKALNPLTPGRVWMPVWGGHHLRYLAATRRNEYYGIPIRDNRTLVGFQTQTPAVFKKVPFFVGTAHSGYHVFPGTFGQVVEGHSVRALSSKDNLEFSDFNPLDQDHHGGPKWTNSEHYRSGVIVVPPGMMGR
jgi:hypothetical protein